MKLALSALVFSISLPMFLHAAEVRADARASARAEVQQLVERFRHAILKKDGDAVRGMFLPDGSWFRVLDPPSLTAARVKKPETKQFTPGSYEEFAKFLKDETDRLSAVIRRANIHLD